MSKKTYFDLNKSRLEEKNKLLLEFKVKHCKKDFELEISSPENYKITIKLNNKDVSGLFKIQNGDIIEISLEKKEVKKNAHPLNLNLRLRYHKLNKLISEDYSIISKTKNDPIKIFFENKRRKNFNVSRIFVVLIWLLLVCFSIKYSNGWIGLFASFILFLFDFDAFSWLKKLFTEPQQALILIINPQKVFKKEISDFFSSSIGKYISIFSFILLVISLLMFFPIKLNLLKFQFYSSKGEVINDESIPFYKIDSLLFSLKPDCGVSDTTLIKLGYTEYGFLSLQLNYFKFKYRPIYEITSIDSALDIKKIISYQSNHLDTEIYKKLLNSNSSLAFDKNILTFYNKEKFPENFHSLSATAKVNTVLNTFVKSNYEYIYNLWLLMHPKNDGDILFYYTNSDTALSILKNKYIDCYKRFSNENKDMQSITCKDIDEIYKKVLYDNKSNLPKFDGGNLDLFYKQISIYLLFTSFDNVLDMSSYDYKKFFNDINMFFETYNGFSQDHRILRMFSLLISFIEEKNEHKSYHVENSKYLLEIINMKIVNPAELSKRKMFFWYLFVDFYCNNITLTKEREKIFRTYLKGFLNLDNHSIITNYPLKKTHERQEFENFVESEMKKIFLECNVKK